MTAELKPALGRLIKEDPQQVNFRKKVQEWASDKTTYEEMRKHYPSYLLSAHERIARFIRRSL